MGDSLQEQLRALGLAGNRPDERNRKSKSKRKPSPARRTKTASGPNARTEADRELTLDQAYALRAREEKREAERTRRQKLEEDRRRRQLNKAIRQIVTARRQNLDAADIARNFMFNGRIRKIYVTAEQQRALAANDLGIVYLAGGYHLLEPDAVEAVRQLSADHVVDLGVEADADDSDHPIPDDLVW